LEDGDVLDDDGDLQQMDDEQEQDGDDGPDVKRRRIETESPPEPEQPAQAMGLLSADTLEGLKYFAEIRKQNGGAPPPAKKAVAPPLPPTGLGLADYGSDED